MEDGQRATGGGIGHGFSAGGPRPPAEGHRGKRHGRCFRLAGAGRWAMEAGMISLREARAIIAAMVNPRAAVATTLADAAGRVLATDAVADDFHPAGDRSQMDGYVVRGDAVPGRFRLGGVIAAGDVPGAPLGDGEARRIFTGALLPPGGGRVVMQEDARPDGKDAVWLETFGPRLFIRERGSEARPGDVLLRAGTVLNGPELAILAQLGHVSPLTVPPPAVNHLATGGELVDPAETPAAGQIRDTNTTLLRALLGRAGVSDFSTRRIADNPGDLAAAIDTPHDILLISGGASVGDFDFGATALKKAGFTVHFDRVNIRPGKPLTFATRDTQAAFVIPGNPVSHFVCYHTAVRLAIDRAAGRPEAWPTVWIDLVGGEAIGADPRETWWPARCHARDGRLVAEPLRWTTSGNTFSLVGTNALLAVNDTSPANGRALALLLEPPAL